MWNNKVIVTIEVEFDVLTRSNVCFILQNVMIYIYNICCILVMWFGCRFLDTEVDGSNSGISMICP